MATPMETPRPDDDSIRVERRADGAVVVRVKSSGAGSERLPDAVFSFRCGDPQYAYWLARIGPADGPSR